MAFAADIVHLVVVDSTAVVAEADHQAARYLEPIADHSGKDIVVPY